MYKIYQGEVKENEDKTGKGLIKVRVPKLNVDYPDNLVTAQPICFSFIGNKTIEDNNCHAGSYIVPPTGSIVFLLIDEKNPNDAYYFGGTVPSGQWEPILPESKLEEAHKRYTLFRSSNGSSIIISEAQNDNSVRITGKKKKYKKEAPEESVLPHKDNQCIIKIDNSNDSIHIYSLGDITIENNNASIHISSDGHITITCKSMTITSEGGIFLDTPQVATSGVFVGPLNGIADIAKVAYTCGI